MARSSSLVAGSQISLIEFLFILFLVVYFFLPSSFLMMSWYNVFILSLVYFLWVVFVTIKSSKLQNKLLKYFFVILFITIQWAFFTEIKTVVGDDIQTKYFFTWFQQLFFSFFPSLLLYRMILYSTRLQRRILLFTLLGVIAYVIKQTMQELLLNSHVTRQNDVDMEIAKADVANFSFVYTMVSFVPLIIHFIFKYKSGIGRVLMIFLIIFVYNFLLKAQYTLSFLISIIASLMMLYNFIPRDKHILYWISILVGFVLSPYILNWLSVVIVSEDMKIRLHEVSELLAHGRMEYNLESRFTLYARSVMDFLRSPIWGNYYLNYNPHSSFLGTMAYLGVLGTIPYFYLYLNIRTDISSFIKGVHERKTFDIVFMTIILTGFTNPIHMNFSYAFVVFFIAPLCLIEFSEKERK